MMDPVKMLRLVKNDDAFILDKLLKHDKINSSNFSSRHVSSSYKKQTDEIDKIPFNILIAEDNKINAELMKAIIESSEPQKFSKNEASVKFNIIIAEDGKKALDIVFSLINIDLIILDLMMPLINGFDVLEKIRSCDSFGNSVGNIPVLIVSALNESSIISKGIELGANDYITKPIVKNIFKSKVNSLINLKKLHDTLENSENIIMSLALAIEAKDKYTSGHSKRVSILAYNFGKYLGLHQEDCLLLKRAGCIHDIGKIGIPNDILNKTEKLSDKELNLIRNHSITSSDICKPLISLKKESYLVRYHHERFDGNGYPGELICQNIPYLSRVLSVVDSYDAMTSDRPYRQALTMEAALFIFENEKNSGQWDPEIVDEFIKFINL